MLILKQFLDSIERRGILTEVRSSGSDALDSAQAKASSVVQEASSVVADVTSAIVKPTLLANMTADKACLELLSFSECQSTPIDQLFLTGFWILVCGAIFTATTFFKCQWLNELCRSAVSLLAVTLGLLATMFFLALTILCWTIYSVVASKSGSEGAGENARSIYSSFTSIAFISVLSWVVIRHHKRGKTCDKCYEIDHDPPRSVKTRSFTSDDETLVVRFVQAPEIHQPQKAAQPGEGKFGEWI